MENNRYLTAYDIADILDVSKVTVYSWMQKGYLEFSLSGNLQRVTKENLLKYLKKIGNSQGAMKDFEEDIYNYNKQKDEINEHFNELKLAYRQNNETIISGEEVKWAAILNSTTKIRKANRWKDGIKDILEIYKRIKANDPFEDSEKAEKYISEAKTSEEKTKRVAEVMNYEEGKCSKPPWNEDK